MAIIALLTFLLIPALGGLQKAGTFSRAVYDMSDSINFARSSAMAGNTYVYLGLTEVDRTQPLSANPQVAGNLGEVALAAVATSDGTPDTTTTGGLTSWTNYNQNGTGLILLRPVQLFDFLYIAPILPPATSGGMERPQGGANGSPPIVYNIKSGDKTLFPSNEFSSTPFSLPLSTSQSSGKYIFASAIPFSPQGSITLNGTAVQWIEIDLQPFAGTAPVEPPSATQGNQAALMIDGGTGAVTVYRP